jgi:hypothetical protein
LDDVRRILASAACCLDLIAAPIVDKAIDSAGASQGVGCSSFTLGDLALGGGDRDQARRIDNDVMRTRWGSLN